MLRPPAFLSYSDPWRDDPVVSSSEDETDGQKITVDEEEVVEEICFNHNGDQLYIVRGIMIFVYGCHILHCP